MKNLNIVLDDERKMNSLILEKMKKGFNEAVNSMKEYASKMEKNILDYQICILTKEKELQKLQKLFDRESSN